ncbi:putative toxin [Margalitia sp. FSL K6-0131]|uniref:putative toxin n=2 Tax=Margalitia sp. FSL K6-0131 TaxID=2954604 RepID=UPI0030F6E6B7
MKVDTNGKKQEDIGFAGGPVSFELGEGLSGGGSTRYRGTGKVPTQLTRGMRFEAEVLKQRGLDKNSKKVGKSIPDSLTGGRITEIKDVKYVYKSKQFRDYIRDGRPIDLIVNKHTKISKPLRRAIINSGGRIIRH